MGPLLVFASLVAALDQATKLYVLARLPDGHSIRFGPLALRKIVNPMKGRLISSRPALLTLWAAEVVALALLVLYEPSFQSPSAQAALGCVLGGVTGNMIDRVWRAGIVDFVDLRFWPVFNVADSGIVGGVLLTAVVVWH